MNNMLKILDEGCQVAWWSNFLYIFINVGNIKDWLLEEGDFMPNPPSPPPMTTFKSADIPKQ